MTTSTDADRLVASFRADLRRERRRRTVRAYSRALKVGAVVGITVGVLVGVTLAPEPVGEMRSPHHGDTATVACEAPGVASLAPVCRH